MRSFARMVFACNMENPSPIHNPSPARLHLANSHVPLQAPDSLSIWFMFELVLDAHEMCVTGTEMKFRSTWSSGMMGRVNPKLTLRCAQTQLGPELTLAAVGRAGQPSQLVLLKWMATPQTSLPPSPSLAYHWIYKQKQWMISWNLSSPFSHLFNPFCSSVITTLGSVSTRLINVLFSTKALWI